MLDTNKWHSTTYGAGWAYDNTQNGPFRRRRRGFTFQRNPKRFLLLATIFVLGMAQLIAKVEFGWSF